MTFDEFLKNEFLQRKKQNSSYSLRAFARDLGIQPSPLSAILNGKRAITSETKMKLGMALNLSLSEINKIKTKKEVNENNEKTEKILFCSIDNETFKVLSEWYHYAILELFEIEGFEQNNKWIAKKLGITTFEVKDALERLENFGFLTKTKGKLKVCPEHSFSSSLVSEITDEAKKRHQKILLEKSSKAISSVSIDKRDHSGVLFAINEEDLPKAKEMTKKYRQQMTALFNKNVKKTSVYQLQIGLFPVSF